MTSGIAIEFCQAAAWDTPWLSQIAGGEGPHGFIIRIANGAITPDERHQHNSAHTHLTVTDANVALNVTHALIQSVVGSRICVGLLGVFEDAPIWIPELARLRARCIRSANLLNLYLEEAHSLSPQAQRWACYSGEVSLAPK